MKLLVLSTNGVIHDGITSWLTQYFALMDRTGIEVDTVASPNAKAPLLENLRRAKVTVHTLPSRRENTAAYLRALRRLIKSNSYDVVHVNGSSGTVALELMCCVGTGTGVRIVHSRNTRGQHPWLHRLLRPLMNALCTDRLACGEDAGKWLFGDDQFTVIPNGRDFSAYTFDGHMRNDLRSRLGLSRDDIAVGHVGYFHEQKNHRFLVDAFADALRLNSNLRLFLIGDGRLRTSIERRVRELGIIEEVVFVGETDEVASYLSAWDLAVLPSIYEGFPNVVIEWQISGLSSLVSSNITRECAVTQLVSILPAQDSAAWARAMADTHPLDRPTAALSAQKILKSAGFEAKDGAAMLRDFYLRIATREAIL